MAQELDFSGNLRRIIHATVRGHVQGVGYRFFVRQSALHLDLSGYVRNQHDGSVFVTAQGDTASLEQLLALLRKGPSGAYVTNVDCEWIDDAQDIHYGNFEVRY